jgi:hypothetical protein
VVKDNLSAGRTVRRGSAERNEEAVITDPVVYMGRGTYDPGLALCGTEQGGNRE